MKNFMGGHITKPFWEKGRSHREHSKWSHCSSNAYVSVEPWESRTHTCNYYTATPPCFPIPSETHIKLRGVGHEGVGCVVKKEDAIPTCWCFRNPAKRLGCTICTIPRWIKGTKAAYLTFTGVWSFFRGIIWVPPWHINITSEMPSTRDVKRKFVYKYLGL